MNKKAIFAVLFLILGISVFYVANAQTKFDFSLTLSPAAITLDKPLTTVNKTVYMQTKLLSGKATKVNFSVSGLPSGVTLAYNSGSCTPTCIGNVKLAISSKVAGGTYNIKISAVGGTATKTATLQLTVKSGSVVTPTPAPTPTPKPTPTPTGNSLTVIKSGTGSGSIKSTDGKIVCGTDCNEKYSKVTPVTLEAIPAENAIFGGWSGCDSTSGVTAKVSQSELKKQIAALEAQINELQNNGQNNSGITIDQLLAQIAALQAQINSQLNTICTISVNGTKTATATFSKIACIDTDRAVDYYTRGKVYVEQGWTYEDACCGLDGQDICEGYCDGNYIAVKAFMPCEYGCSMGACLKTKPNCVDTDKQEDIYTKGYATINNGSTKIYDQCGFEQGYIDVNSLMQSYCDGYKIKYNFFDCPNGCKNGACIMSNKSSIKVIYPNGGETLKPGQTYSITWSMENPCKVKIYACKGSSFTSCSLLPDFPTDGVATGALGDTKLGEYKFYVDKKSSYIGQKLKIKIVSMNDRSIYDLSDNSFVISSAIDDKPSLQIISPNGGEKYSDNTWQEIKWVSSGVSNITIELNSTVGFYSRILAYGYDASVGKFSWIPSSFANTSNDPYFIKIYDSKDYNALDVSDGYFNIIPPSTDSKPLLTIEIDGSAYGKVASDIGGINCGSYCMDSFSENAIVTLKATPGEFNSSFGKWEGNCIDNTGGKTDTCKVKMDKPKTVKAYFYSNIGSYNIVIDRSGTGKGTVTGPDINCPDDCKATVKSGTTIKLIAKPEEGSKFIGWIGDCSDSAKEVSILVKSDINTTAIFDKDTNGEYNHLIVIDWLMDKGQGKVKSEPEGIDCPGKCDKEFINGSSVKLTATINPGYTFEGWGSQDCESAGTSTVCTILMNTGKQIYPLFNKNNDLIKVIYPNGGEKLSFSTPFTVKWKTEPDISKVDISIVSTEYKGACTLIRDVDASLGKYTFNIADNQLCESGHNITSGKYKIELLGHYAASSIYGYSDQSDGEFSLTGKYINSKIETNSSWSQGSSYQINWESAGVDRISIAAVCSDDVYYRITNNILASKGTTRWRIPTYKTFTNPCRIWIGEYKGLKSQGKWSDVSPAAYNQKYAETNVTILGNRSSSVMDSLYGSFLYSILRLFPGF